VVYDFVSERTHDGRPLKILTLIDEYSRECLALLVERHITSDDVLYCLADLFIRHGYRNTFVPTTGRSSRPKWSGSGWGILG